jgi:repressor LexA
MDYKRVPLIGKVAAGEPIFASESYGVAVPGPYKADYALEIQGESMMPTYLPGDIIYIREQPTIDYQGQVAVVLLDDEATVKHVYRQKDGLLLISDNPAYEPMTKRFEDFATVRILGKVCGYTRMYRE